MQDEKHILGIDIGASGIKGAVVDLETGALLNERIRIDTPSPASPKAMAKTFAELVRQHEWEGTVGCGFPSVIKNGVAGTASNISKEWIGKNVEGLLSDASGCEVSVLNDADAAGIAEMRFGLGQDEEGVVLLITIGSGLGSALFVDGQLVPNTELGQLKYKGAPVEKYASNNARKRNELSWEVWGKRFSHYLDYVIEVITPDLILLGGGVSKKFEKYEQYIDVDVPVKPASLLNNAGTVGAAIYAREVKRG